MKKLFYIFVLVILITGCSKGNQLSLDNSVRFNTMLSPKNELSIVRKLNPKDYSYKGEGLTDLPSYNGEMWQVDVRSSDLSKFNLIDRIDDLLYADFDTKTKWPNTLPQEFDPQKIMELGKNPGLGVRSLHAKDITGKGVGVAIIDMGLLVDHVEYKEQLKMYEEIHCMDEYASMHGAAVASIAVGKTVGVAPEADLYFIAEAHGTVKNEKFVFDLTWLAKCIDRIVEVNEGLSDESKIRVISISLNLNTTEKGIEEVVDSIERAEKDNIYTIFVSMDKFYGLGRDPMNDPDKVESYSRGLFWKNEIYNNKALLIPMDSRCTASPTGVDDYAFYRTGGMSWSVPYAAGLYALACQVKPDITPEMFWEKAYSTSDTIYKDTGEVKLAKLINPQKLIEEILKIK